MCSDSSQTVIQNYHDCRNMLWTVQEEEKQDTRWWSKIYGKLYYNIIELNCFM